MGLQIDGMLGDFARRCESVERRVRADEKRKVQSLCLELDGRGRSSR